VVTAAKMFADMSPAPETRPGCSRLWHPLRRVVSQSVGPKRRAPLLTLFENILDGLSRIRAYVGHAFSSINPLRLQFSWGSS
jgi:hypothetical protein